MSNRHLTNSVDGTPADDATGTGRQPASQRSEGCESVNLTSRTSPRPTSAARGLRWDNRFLAPGFITVLLLVSQLTFGMLESWTRTLLAIAAATASELLLGKLIGGRIPHLASSYVSGISVGILIRSPFFWPYALCAVLSIASKYVLRLRDRHLWNPSNFGVSAMLFLYPTAVAGLSIQWGNFLWPMLIVWGLGSIIISRLKRFHICLTYVVSFVALSLLRSLVTGSPFLASVAPLTGPMYQLFVFFMLTDPRTTVSTKWGQCLVAFLVAAVEMLLRLAQVIYAPFYALFLVGPAAMALEIAWKSRKSSVAQAAPPSEPLAAIPASGRVGESTSRPGRILPRLLASWFTR